MEISAVEGNNSTLIANNYKDTEIATSQQVEVGDEEEGM